MKRLVIVDDDKLVRTSAGLYFESAGWSVALADGAAQAEACMSAPFDAMICDLNLRGAAEGGLAILAAARRVAPHAILVLLSGAAASDLGEARPDAVLQKPVRLPRLEQLLAELANR